MEDFCLNKSFNLFLYATVISLALAKDLSSAEQDLLGNFLFIVGQNLCSIAAFTNDCLEICEDTNTYTSNNNNESNLDITNSNINTNGR